MSDKSIKIIFFGNTEFSNPVLIKCAESYNVCSVVTNPSKKMGRGQKFVDTPVKILLLLMITRPMCISANQIIVLSQHLLSLQKKVVKTIHS